MNAMTSASEQSFFFFGFTEFQRVFSTREVMNIYLYLYVVVPGMPHISRYSFTEIL
jgi:hypothetical protein